MKRVLQWKSMSGWETVSEFELRNAADFFELDPLGKLLPIARALVKSPFVVTKFGGKEHGLNSKAA